jgi:hypothetical protein
VEIIAIIVKIKLYEYNKIILKFVPNRIIMLLVNTNTCSKILKGVTIMNERENMVQAIKELLPECEDNELLQLILAMLIDSSGSALSSH